MASHRHQSHLDGIINFPPAPIFSNDEQRAQATARFRRIVNHSEAVEPASRYNPLKYNRPALIRLTFEYARSAESRDRFLAAFFQSLALDILGHGDLSDEEFADLREPLFGFAEFLMTNFFLPRMLSLSLSTIVPFPPLSSPVLFPT